MTVTEQTLQSKIEATEKLTTAESNRKSLAAPLISQIVSSPVDLSAEDWVLSVLTQAQEKIQEVKCAPPQPVPETDNRNTEVEELELKSKKLEDEVVHYQRMLKQTETLLSNLQVK